MSVLTHTVAIIYGDNVITCLADACRCRPDINDKFVVRRDAVTRDALFCN